MSIKVVNVPKIIFFGDSLTQLGWSYEGGWLSILANNFVRRLDVIGRGYSGYNTRMCRPLLPTLFPTEQSLQDCQFFVIFLGANDVSTAEQHVPVDEYEANLIWMVRYIQNMGVLPDRIMLVSLPPVDEAKWGAHQLSEGKPLTRELKNYPIYVKACAQASLSTGAHFLNLHDAMIAQQNWMDMLSDGLHFSRKGSEFVAHILTAVFEDRLTTRCPVLFPDWKQVDKERPEQTIYTPCRECSFVFSMICRALFISLTVL
ncbi:Isoamyl acetate-hydrolyzing esterase [Fasciola gigantica]|uniref:Isoamyl acetate-hydrolyzing esterase n=1 Tax=Fasciola gigantica TaxID=46835 RepID=A0A504YFH4_FASGI|nr:Isoamyl acetate-hydrolyzing esterase [Fasciola gigantica]